MGQAQSAQSAQGVGVEKAQSGKTASVPVVDRSARDPHPHLLEALALLCFVPRRPESHVNKGSN